MSTRPTRTPALPPDRLSARDLSGPARGLRVLRTGVHAAFPGRRMPNALSIGSSRRQCDLVVDDDPYVSSIHCYVERRGGVLVVHDYGSTNGTRVNGAVVRESCEVPVGSVITAGQTAVVVYGKAGAWLDGPGLGTFIRQALRDYGSVSRAAEALGVPRPTLARWLHRRSGRGRPLP